MWGIPTMYVPVLTPLIPCVRFVRHWTSGFQAKEGQPISRPIHTRTFIKITSTSWSTGLKKKTRRVMQQCYVEYTVLRRKLHHLCHLLVLITLQGWRGCCFEPLCIVQPLSNGYRDRWFWTALSFVLIVSWVLNLHSVIFLTRIMLSLHVSLI